MGARLADRADAINAEPWRKRRQKVAFDVRIRKWDMRLASVWNGMYNRRESQHENTDS